MKNLFTFLLVTMLTLTFATSCGSDDEDIIDTPNKIEQMIVGDWEIEYMYDFRTDEYLIPTMENEVWYMVFTKSKGCKIYDFFNSKNGTYKIEGNVIVVDIVDNIGDKYMFKYIITKLTENEMELTTIPNDYGIKYNWKLHRTR